MGHDGGRFFRAPQPLHGELSSFRRVYAVARVGFLLGRSVSRIALGGGAPVPMLADLDINTSRGVAWGDNDWIYYTPNYSAGLWRVRASGGDPEQLTTLAQGEKTHRFPFVLPGSRAVLFEVGTSKITSFDEARIEVLTLETRTRQPLVPGGTYPLYVSTGHLLYTRAGRLTAVPFDAERLTLNGASETVADGISSTPHPGPATTASRGMGLSSARSAASRRCHKRWWRSTRAAPKAA